MFDRQREIIVRALHLIARLPSGTAWMLAVTDQDGEGEDPTLGTLSITPEPHLSPSKVDPTTAVIEALGGGFAQVGGGMVGRVDGELEVVVDVEQGHKEG